MERSEKIAALNAKKTFSFEDLCTIMELLRSEGGCSWDREQTHESIRKDFIEETYEVIEAIDTNDPELLPAGDQLHLDTTEAAQFPQSAHYSASQ